MTHPPVPPIRIRAALGLLAAALLLAGCGSADDGAAPANGAVAAAETRVQEIQHALDSWRGADSAPVAHRAAETVSNLITGPGVDLYGDADGDGTVDGPVTQGLLPGRAGEASLGAPLSGCAGPDLLGGSWADPTTRWRELTDRIATWTPQSNRFPQLPSHALRVVGWARLTLGSTSVTDAHEYAGHAQLHVDAVRTAIAACR